MYGITRSRRRVVFQFGLWIRDQMLAFLLLRSTKEYGLNIEKLECTEIEKNETLNNLKLPICAKGYISPTMSETILIGSTYNNKKEDKLLLEDHIENRKK